ncbi:hypothetical protein ACTA71_008264 [Dictyostelium dimigraforme]
MATLFEILNTINSNNNNFQGCKRQFSVNKRIDILPSMDVTMTNDRVIIETELAGVLKKDIDIDIKDSILIIQGEKKKNMAKQQYEQSELERTSQSTNNKEEDEPSIEKFEEDDAKSKSELNRNTTTTTTTTTKTTSTISNESKDEDNNKKFISERQFGNFKRYLNLSNILYQLDLNSINTQFENGLLTITIKKKSDYSNTIKINVN